jgi:hypothetical protein
MPVTLVNVRREECATYSGQHIPSDGELQGVTRPVTRAGR